MVTVSTAIEERQRKEETTLPRLSDVLFKEDKGGFHSFAALPSNVDAIEAALLFANGLQKFVVIHGESGWGKTHLLESAAKHHRKLFPGSTPQVLSASEWVSGFWSRMQPAPLILDHVQDCIAKTRQRIQLRLALERRVRAGWPTMLSLTGDRLPPMFSLAVPNLRDWQVATIRQPAKEERQVIVASMAKREGLALSDSLRRILSEKLTVNGRSYEGAINRLKLLGNRWCTDTEVIHACGILNAYFSDRPNWDLRDEILTIVRQHAEDPADASPMALYLMLKVAGLNEDDVAHFMEIEPNKAYAGAKSFAGRVLVDSECRNRLSAASKELVRNLEVS